MRSGGFKKNFLISAIKVGFPPCVVVLLLHLFPLQMEKGASFNLELVDSLVLTTRGYSCYVVGRRQETEENKVFHYLSTSCGVGTKEQWDKSTPRLLLEISE